MCENNHQGRLCGKRAKEAMPFIFLVQLEWQEFVKGSIMAALEEKIKEIILVTNMHIDNIFNVFETDFLSANLFHVFFQNWSKVCLDSQA